MKVWLWNKCPSPDRGDLCLESFPAVLGRGGDCDIPVPIGFVSRRHCRFVRRGDEIWVQDLESLNGTFVNGCLAIFPTPVNHGDELRLGPMSFRVALMTGEDAAGLATLRLGNTPIELTLF